MPFQKQVNLTPAPAQAGDFASSNPRASVLAGEGGLVAGAGGVLVGNFAWVNGNLVQSYGTAPNAPDGFVHREMQALIQTYLAESGVNVPQGFPVNLFNEGDFWALNSGSGSSSMNEAVYARYSDGAVFFGSAPAGASVTGSIGSTNTAAIGATFTASAGVPATELVVTSVTGLISIGDYVSGTGITPGTTILSQISGTPNGAGTYGLSAANTASAATVTSYGWVLKVSSTTGLISIGDSVSGGAGFPAAATIASQVSGTPGGAGDYIITSPASAYVASATGVTSFGNVLDVTGVTSGALAVGDPVSGSGIPPSASIAQQTSGTAGSIGTYVLDVPATAYAASTTVTVVAGVVTAWKAKSVGAPGELVKISTWG